MRTVALILIAGLGTIPAAAQEGDVSAERGGYIAIIGGCHDCHTANYGASNGQIDPALALKGDAVGFQGPWGTTYPANLRVIASTMTEDDWVGYLKNLETRPPMPWFNVRHFPESDMRALYAYVKSLGEPGETAPGFVPPGETPKTPYIVFAPPVMPQ